MRSVARARRPLTGDLPRPCSVHGMRASGRARSLARMHAPTYALMDAASRARLGGAPPQGLGGDGAVVARARHVPHAHYGPAEAMALMTAWAPLAARSRIGSRSRPAPPGPPRASKRQFEREGVPTVPLTLLSVRIIKVFPYCETRRTGQFQKKVGAHKLSEHKDMNNDNMEPLGRRAPRTVVKWTFVQKVPELLHFGARS